ncbi:MAG: TetR family transcriptional regulator [Actinomycetia bacterium]|nr:TetR family transcriptional regulator [Actinomycetes bacterium]
MSTTLEPGATRPSGRSQVPIALLAATERLCTVSQPSSFTVADIVREANVTTSLLYFYFASKDEIILATLRSIASDLDELAAEVSSPNEMATAVSSSLMDRPAFARILAWLTLEGRAVTKEMGDHPFLARLMTTLATDESTDPHTQAGSVVAVLLANAFFSGGISEALGRQRDDERIPGALDELISTVLTPQA